jgi:hypothetical protein
MILPDAARAGKLEADDFNGRDLFMGNSCVETLRQGANVVFDLDQADVAYGCRVGADMDQRRRTNTAYGDRREWSIAMKVRDIMTSR